MKSIGKMTENSFDIVIRDAIALDIAECIPVPAYSPLPDKRKSHIAITMRRAMLAIAVVIAIATLGFGTVLAASAELRAQIGGLLIERDNGIHIHASGRDSVIADAPDEWLGCFWFETMPEGYTLTEIISSRTSSIVRMDREDGGIIWFGENWTGKPSMSYPEGFDETALESLVFNETEALSYSVSGGTFLMWEEEGCMLVLIAPGTVEDAIQIASSVHPIF